MVAGSSALCRGTMTPVTVILFSVSVPVLSVRITLVEPSVSTAESCSTSALRRAIRRTPRASARVATIGSPSGTVATASAIAVLMTSVISFPLNRPRIPMTVTRAMQSHPITFPRESIRSSSGVFLSAAFCTRAVIRPSSVCMPVLTTTPSAFPLVMAVPLNSMLSRSAISVSSGSTSIVFSTGTDSPVRSDSSLCTLDAASNRTSAVTTSPPSKRTMSPGTKFSADTRCATPPRRTVVSVLPSWRSASVERTARSSVTNPIRVLITMTTRIAKPSRWSPRAKESTEPAISR